MSLDGSQVLKPPKRCLSHDTKAAQSHKLSHILHALASLVLSPYWLPLTCKMSNSTVFDPSLCTYATCSVKEYGQLQYIPSLWGNAVFLGIFSAALVAQLGLGVFYRTWGFMIGMVGGTALEILGYAARIQLHFNDFDNNQFIIYLVGLTIGPAFFSGAIYLCLARIIAVYGTAVSWLSPRSITILFIGSDFLSLILQATGGAIASTGDTHSTVQVGVNIMIAGLASQVASTTVFCGICSQIMYTVFRRRDLVNSNSAALRATLKFRFFLWGQQFILHNACPSTFADKDCSHRHRHCYHPHPMFLPGRRAK